VAHLGFADGGESVVESSTPPVCDFASRVAPAQLGVRCTDAKLRL